MGHGVFDFVAEAISVSIGGNMQEGHKPSVAFQGYYFDHDGFTTEKKALVVMVFEKSHSFSEDILGDVSSQDAGEGEIFFRADLFLSEDKLQELVNIALAYNQEKHAIEGYFLLPAEILENEIYFNECGSSAQIMGYGLNISTGLPDDKFGIYEKAWG